MLRRPAFSFSSNSISRSYCLYSMCTTKLPFFSVSSNTNYRSCFLFAKPSFPRLHFQFHCPHFLMGTSTHLCTLAVSAAKASPTRDCSIKVPTKSRKKASRDSPEGVLKLKLDMCSRHGDVFEAIRLYDEAQMNGIRLSQQHYNALLYLCSGSFAQTNAGDGDVATASDLVLKRGFEIFQQMILDKVAPNEATFTNVARLAVAVEDPEMAFDLVKQMQTSGIPPRLRSYGPALFGFCEKRMAKRAYEVDEHMAESGVSPEEPELSALFKVSADENKPEKVYEMLHRLRATVRQVTEPTLGIIEDWFMSEEAAGIGKENWDVNKIREGVVSGGGGWHGQGWLGTGKWRVVRTQMDEKGVCGSCGERLVCIDIDPGETENFATSLANLACQREVKAGFVQFQEWLQKHGPFDAVIDGANVGLINQRNFNFHQLKTVVNRIRQLSPSRRFPLIVLHRSRVTGGPARHPGNKSLIESWEKAGALYPTPPGSNDDWYWLYAAVSSKCLLVTNDEMRDHLFELLGTSFFPRWKEKHQVRLSLSKNGLSLVMPPLYSIVIQESEFGSWHVPTSTDKDLENPRQWLCATRPTNSLSPC